MKTLDEVIKANECCDHGEPDSRCEDCPYNGVGSCCLERENDALHYLKEYKANQEDPDGDHQQLEKAQKLLWEFYQNDPLTWDELKQMEGKPVWVEIGDGSKGWGIIRRITDSGIVSGSDGFIGIDTAYGMDTTWQAYRKER